MRFDLDMLIPDARPSTLPDRAPRCYEDDLLPPVEVGEWVKGEWDIIGRGARREEEVASIPDDALRALWADYQTGTYTVRQLAARWGVGQRLLAAEWRRRLGITRQEEAAAIARRSKYKASRRERNGGRVR